MTAGEDSRVARLLRWYPAAWRDRYGEEYAALLADTLAEEPRSLRRTLDVARHGLGRRLALSGLTSREVPAPDRARTGALAVLGAWAAFVVAGCGLAKYAEHWGDHLSPAGRHLPGAAFGLVQILAALASGVIVLASLATLGVLSSWLRRGSWRQVRRQLLWATAGCLTAVLFTAAVLVVVHVDPVAPPATTRAFSPGFAALGLAWLGSLLFGLVTGIRAVVVVARRIELPARLLRLEVAAAGLVSVAMTAVLAATAFWWFDLPSTSRSLLEASGRGANLADPTMVAVLVLMVGAVAVAAYGAARALRALPEVRSA